MAPAYFNITGRELWSELCYSTKIPFERQEIQMDLLTETLEFAYMDK